jgi:DNA-binding transcriptional regulator LsrR (DeoR family)
VAGRRRGKTKKSDRKFTDLNAVRAAYWVGERGLTQEAVADEMGVSRATVSRLIDRAANRLHCFEEVPRFIRSNVPEQWLHLIEDERRYAALADQIARLPARDDRRPTRIRVFDSGSSEETETAIERRQIQFGAHAAPYIAERLTSARHIGIAWGSTLSRVIDGLERTEFAWPEDWHPRIVPVSAEPMRFAHNEFTSSTLARRLDGIINARQPADRQRLALTGIPAFIPHDFRKLLPESSDWPEEEHRRFNASLRAFYIKSSPAYAAIFGPPDPLIKKIDALVTSLGTSVCPMGFCNEDLRETGHVTREELAELVAGDIGGVLLPKSATTKPTVDDLMSLWTGISYDDLDRVAHRAIVEKTPGTIVIVIGSARIEPLCEILAEGLCTELLLDRDAADALPGALARRFGTPP